VAQASDPSAASGGVAAIFGLGNPGDKYQDTRHNIGFLIIDALIRKGSYSEQKGNRLTTLHRARVEGQEVWLGKPQTFMNLSGQAVNWVSGSKKVPPERVMVVVDDIALPFGKMRVRGEGSAGGHNGLKSIIADLGTQKFPRLRVGVGPIPEGWDQVNFVLGRFRAEERKALDDIIERSVLCLESWIKRGLEPTMNEFNRDPS